MGKFSDEEIKLAQKVESEYGVPASVTLGQYALESGYGKSTVGKNNYFNIKGNGQGGYRDYSSKEESFMDFGKLLSSERYTSQTANATTIAEYVQGVKDGGYAEDSEYVTKVLSIIKTNNLTQYDSGSLGSSERVGGGHKVTDRSNDIGLTWWGDIVTVVFSVLLVVAGVVFVALIFLDNSKIEEVKKKVKEVTK